MDYGIKYLKVKLDHNLYALIAQELIEGYSVTESFWTEEQWPALTAGNLTQESNYIIGAIESEKNLIEHYGTDDTEFLKEFYLCEHQEEIIIAEVYKGVVVQKKVPTKSLRNATQKADLVTFDNDPIVALNSTAIKNIIEADDIAEIRKRLLSYSSLLEIYNTAAKNKGVTNILMENGKVQEVRGKSTPQKTNDNSDSNMLIPLEVQGITVQGLEKYILERVFGHPDEIRKIATILIMNYHATSKDKAESILIPGPTGVGKTATFEAASEYLGIPFIMVNTPNIVPEGIKGTSLEDSLYSLLLTSGFDKQKAGRGIIVLDEFDKLGSSDLDIKQAVKDIMYKFIEGAVFTIDKNNEVHEISTSLLSKVFLGTFSDIYKKRHGIGFGAEIKKSNGYDPRKLHESSYYGAELITRIPHIIPYGDLGEHTKKRILLESKLSRYLIKKERYEREFGVTLIADDSYVEAALTELRARGESVRELNNLVSNSLLDAEYELLCNPNQYQRLILTHETIRDSKKFNLS